MKTLLEKFHAAGVNEIVNALKANEWPGEASPVHVCYGWDGAMSPLNRAAFVYDYGEAVTASLEAEARAKVSGIAAIGREYHAHMEAAQVNMAKPSSEWREGDYLLALDNGLKFDHGDLAQHARYFIEDEGAKGRVRLCRVVRIEDKPAGFFDDPKCLNIWHPQPNEGGAASDDVPDGVDIDSFRQDERATYDAYLNTYYTLAVLIRAASGEWVLIDPEGFTYARYLLFPQNYRAMFPAHVKAAQDEIQVREDVKKADADARHAAYEARCAKWERVMRPLGIISRPSFHAEMNDTKDNVLRMARHAFPGVVFTLRRSKVWGEGLILSWTNGPTEEEMKAATDFDLFMDRWHEFDGMTDCQSIEHAEFHDFAERHGRVIDGVKFNRKIAATDRNRKPSATPQGTRNALEAGGMVEASVTENTERNGIEIRFTRKPASEVLERIKARRCWRWSKFSKCWYTRANETERAFAHELAQGVK